MAAGKHGSSEVTIVLDDASGNARTITNYLTSLSAAEIEALIQNTNAFGDTWEEHTPTGLKRVPAFDLSGFYDDTATSGPHVTMNAPDSNVQGTTRTLTLGFGNSTTFSGECWVTKYSVLAKNENLTEFACHVQPTGVWAWA